MLGRVIDPPFLNFLNDEMSFENVIPFGTTFSSNHMSYEDVPPLDFNVVSAQHNYNDYNGSIYEFNAKLGWINCYDSGKMKIVSNDGITEQMCQYVFNSVGKSFNEPIDSHPKFVSHCGSNVAIVLCVTSFDVGRIFIVGKYNKKTKNVRIGAYSDAYVYNSYGNYHSLNVTSNDIFNMIVEGLNAKKQYLVY